MTLPTKQVQERVRRKLLAAKKHIEIAETRLDMMDSKLIGKNPAPPWNPTVSSIDNALKYLEESRHMLGFFGARSLPRCVGV